MHRMLEQGLVEETSDRPDPELDHERRCYYRITALGIAVARAEARRFAQLLKLALSGSLAPVLRSVQVDPARVLRSE